MIEKLVMDHDDLTRKESLKDKNKTTIWDKVFNKKKLMKSQKVAILYLTSNGQAIPMEQESKNGFFSIRGKTYHEREDCTWSIGKERLPLALIREKEIIPIGKESWLERTIKEKFLIVETHAMNGIRHAELVRQSGETGKPVNLKAMILLGLAIIVGLAIWQGGFI